MRIEDKQMSIIEIKDGKESSPKYSDWIKQMLNVVPEGGMTYEIMSLRLSIIDLFNSPIVEKDKTYYELNAEQVMELKEISKNMKFQKVHKDIKEFIEYIRNL